MFSGDAVSECSPPLGKTHFGVLTPERSGMELRVASLERTLVDVLDRPHLSKLGGNLALAGVCRVLRPR